MTKTCPACGSAFRVKPSHAAKRTYCSRSCRPEADIGRARSEATLASRLCARVAKGEATECWEWTGLRGRDGYGLIRLGRGKKLATHRVALALDVGRPIPSGAVVMHTCDNPPCCNPAHLRVGTQRDNVHDAVAKRRNRSGKQRLAPADVLAIRAAIAAGESQSAIARRFGVVPSHVAHIKTGRVWGNLG